jgi:hypothetical protein
MIHTTIIISVVAVANTSTFAYFLRQAKKRNPTHFCCHVDPATTSDREKRVLHPPNKKVRKASVRSWYSAGKEKRRGVVWGTLKKGATKGRKKITVQSVIDPKVQMARPPLRIICWCA